MADINKPVENAEEPRKLNFLEEIIENDLASGRYESILTRFPPEPNGYLHLGHAKSLCINFGLAQKYGGKTNLRYDDTNPTKEDTEYVDAIKEDIKWLGFQWEKECYASDYFDQLYEGPGLCRRPDVGGDAREPRYRGQARHRQPLAQPLRRGEPPDIPRDEGRQVRRR